MRQFSGSIAVPRPRAESTASRTSTYTVVGKWMIDEVDCICGSFDQWRFPKALVQRRFVLLDAMLVVLHISQLNDRSID